MFDNIGVKIKSLTKTLCWIGIVCYIIAGLIMMFTLGYIIGLLVAVVGPLVCWISSFIMYGFGRLIENSDIIAQHSLRNIKKYEDSIEREKQKAQNQKQKAQKDKIACLDIPDDVYFDIICPYCREQLSYTKSELLESEVLTCPMCDMMFATKKFKQ